VIPFANIHQVEITSRCNLRCRYCVHPTMERAKEDMTPETFTAAIGWAAKFRKQGTQGSLNLAGIGESTMHPQFIEFLSFARYVLGEQQDIVLATNGLLVTDELAERMAPYRPRVYVSMHRPEKAGPAVEALKRVGLLAGVSADPSIAATDWAGQVKWHVSAARGPCPWVKNGRAMVLSDGRVTRCSFDGKGQGVVARITDDLTAMETAPYALCAKCHLDVGVELNKEEAA
jgi:hypothetical protein